MDGSAGEKREADWEKEERPEEVDEALVEDQALVPPFDGLIIMMINNDPKSTRPWWYTLVGPGSTFLLSQGVSIIFVVIKW